MFKYWPFSIFSEVERMSEVERVDELIKQLTNTLQTLINPLLDQVTMEEKWIPKYLQQSRCSKKVFRGIELDKNKYKQLYDAVEQMCKVVFIAPTVEVEKIAACVDAIWIQVFRADATDICIDIITLQDLVRKYTQITKDADIRKTVMQELATLSSSL
jgi:phosphoribosylformylglycinamidine (FGAM) synthase PurS component